MTMPKDWKPNRKESDNDDYLYKSRNSSYNSSINNEANQNNESNSFQNSKPNNYNNIEPLSLNAKISIVFSLIMVIFWLAIGFSLNIFSDWFYWLLFVFFVIVAPIASYLKSTSTTKKEVEEN